MRHRLALVMMLLASSTVMASMVYHRSVTVRKPGDAPWTLLAPRKSPVDAFNDCVQKRFYDIDQLGMSRLPTVPQHFRYYHDGFSPQTPEEIAAVAKLKEEGWEVGLYLGGRAVLNSGMTAADWEKAGEHSTRRAISKPLVVTGERAAAHWPRPWELWDDARKALAASVSSDSYTSTLGRWSIDARPVRASGESCLGCHSETGAGWTPKNKTHDSTLRVGDAVGVVIYVYSRPSR
jgi:hypothetical protein